MKHSRIVVLFLAMVIPFTAYGQRSRRPRVRSQMLEGVVVDTILGPRWEGIVIESGGKKYSVVLRLNRPEGRDIDPTVVGGNVESPGTRVRVFYTGMYPESSDNITGLDAIRIVKLSNQAVVPRGSSQPASVSNYIGYRHTVPLPSEFREVGGWDDSWNDVPMGIRVVYKGALKMAWLERTTSIDSSGRPYIEVLDVLILPPSTPGQSLLYTRCQVNGKSRSDILAIAENQPRDKKFFGPVRRAWRVNRSRGKFETISPKGMRCEKMIDRG